MFNLKNRRPDVVTRQLSSAWDYCGANDVEVKKDQGNKEGDFVYNDNVKY